MFCRWLLHFTVLQRDDERRKISSFDEESGWCNKSIAKKKAVESTFYRLKSILFSFLYKLSVLTGIRKPVVRNLLFRDFCLNDYPCNAFYANEKEPRVRPRFLMVEITRFELVASSLRTRRSTNWAISPKHSIIIPFLALFVKCFFVVF